MCLPDGVYHLIARGNARQPIVADDHDRRRSPPPIATAYRRYG